LDHSVISFNHSLPSNGLCIDKKLSITAEGKLFLSAPPAEGCWTPAHAEDGIFVPLRGRHNDEAAATEIGGLPPSGGKRDPVEPVAETGPSDL
jgi:hypothetical protein